MSRSTTGEVLGKQGMPVRKLTPIERFEFLMNCDTPLDWRFASAKCQPFRNILNPVSLTSPFTGTKALTLEFFSFEEPVFIYEVQNTFWATLKRAAYFDETLDSLIWNLERIRDLSCTVIVPLGSVYAKNRVTLVPHICVNHDMGLIRAAVGSDRYSWPPGCVFPAVPVGN